MANINGYNQQFTDKAEMWTYDGYVSVGATGAPTLILNQLTTTGALVPVATPGPSSIVSSITRLSTGKYQVNLAGTWIQCLNHGFTSIIDPSLTPAYVSAQVVGNTVGRSGFGPGFTNPQYIQVVFNVAGTPTDLPSGSGFTMTLRLKKSSA